MFRVPRQVWLVSLAAAVVVMAVAAAYAAQSTGQRIVPSINQPIGPAMLAIGPRVLAGSAALIISGLLLLVFLYRRRLFILLWTSGWAVTGLSMLLASREYAPDKLAWFVYGLSQFLAILAALLFVLSADAYRGRLRLRREYNYILVPMMLWFTLSPMLLQSASVFAPGHLLIAGALAAAGVGHLLLLRQVRMLGAAVAGTGLIILAGVNAWTGLTLATPDADGATRALIISAVLYLVTAGGMQLMTFEDMTCELSDTNIRLSDTNTQLEQAKADLREMVITDPLTGCRNRRFFDEIIGRELHRHRRYGVALSLLFVDIDRFKSINDTYGHQVGDEVLKMVAAFLLANIREADFVFRWGGDEFLVLLSCAEAEARKRGEALAVAFTGSPDARTMPAEVHLSIGCAEVRDDAADVMSLVKVADGRMYENKRQAAS